MADYNINSFMTRYVEEYPTSNVHGHDEYRKYNAAKSKAWEDYQNEGIIPWEEATPTLGAKTRTIITPENHVALMEEQAHQLAAIEPTLQIAPEEPCGTCGGTGGAGANIPTPEVTPAPPYEISPEQQAFEDMYGGNLTDWVEAGGYGIPEDTQAQMIQQQTDSLKAREQESLRVMENNMERRGITNSGFIFANSQNIRSNTTKAIAGAIADVQIKSVLMKMASFEKAMGQASQFLGYLSEQSQLKYQPEFATWQAEQMAKMQAWQETMDRQKMAINQAYQQQNIRLQARLEGILMEQQHQYNLELAEMKLEASNKAAKAQGAGSILGTIIGGVFGLINPTG